jgi:hypothetical protein
MQDELSLYPPNVFKETLWGERFLSRMAELKAMQAKIEMLERSKEGNGVWVITWRPNQRSDGSR